MAHRMSGWDLVGDCEMVDIVVQCDGFVAKYTGYREETAVLNKGQDFGTFFYFWLFDNPELQQVLPPGRLAFTLNGRAPELDDVFHAGDVLHFFACPLAGMH